MSAEQMENEFNKPEYDWMREPITRLEFERLKRQSRGHSIAHRWSPTGQFVILDLLQTVLADYERMRFGGA